MLSCLRFFHNSPICHCSLLNSQKHNGKLTLFISHHLKWSVYPISTQNVSNDNKLEQLRNIYPEQEVEIVTCGDIYERWRKQKKYRRVSPGPLKMRIKYIDTAVSNYTDKRCPKRSPVIFVAHGIPGNYSVFSRLIAHFGRNARVIVPTFPHSLQFPTVNNEVGLFRHSVHEKTQVYLDFLNQLKISRVDVLIAHSCGIYPGLYLCLDESMPRVKSLVLLNTGAHRAVRAMKPLLLTKLAGHIGLYPLAYSAISKYAPFLLRLINSPVRNNFDEIVLLAITMAFSEYEKTALQFKELARRKTPTLMIFSKNDKIVESSVSYQVLQILQHPKDNVWHYNSEGNLARKGTENNWLKAVCFENGSHYVFKKYADAVNDEIDQHLKMVLNTNVEQRHVILNNDPNLDFIL